MVLVMAACYSTGHAFGCSDRGAIILAEQPDVLTLMGSAIIAGSGIYMLLRNRL